MGIVSLPLGVLEKNESVTLGVEERILLMALDDPQTKGLKPGPVVRLYLTFCGV